MNACILLNSRPEQQKTTRTIAKVAKPAKESLTHRPTLAILASLAGVQSETALYQAVHFTDPALIDLTVGLHEPTVIDSELRKLLKRSVMRPWDSYTRVSRMSLQGISRTK